MTKEHKVQLTSVSLHMIAMVIMMIDHSKKIFPDAVFLSSIGRIAFPIFAFLLVEGYFHTRDFKKYATRLLLFALISEIPFDLMVSGTAFYLSHQNVLWTFLIGLGLIFINEQVKKHGNLFLRVFTTVGTVILGYYIGMLTNVDYMQAGVLTVLTFYFFRKRTWWCFLLQLVSLIYLNFAMLGSYAVEFTLFGQNISFPRQGFAVLALLPIWLYRGKQGAHNKWLQRFYYSFYPGHMLIISVMIGFASPYMLLVFLVPVVGALVWRLIGEKGQEKVRLKLEELAGPALAMVVMTAVAVLMIAAPFLTLLDTSVDTVTIKYVMDSITWARGSYNSAITSKNEKVIDDWLAFCDENVPNEKQRDFNAMSRRFPAYVVEYRRGNKLIKMLWITQLESTVYDQFGRGKYVGFVPQQNPYYEQAGRLMDVMR